jgi:hypothetical protein
MPIPKESWVFESHLEPLLPWPKFRRRLKRHGGVALLVIGFSLAIGTAGYTFIAGQEPLTAFLNASMLLGGMGPVGDTCPDPTNPCVGGRLFAALFALYAGLMFLLSAGVLLAPVLHRLLHWLHLEEASRRSGGGAA